VGSNHYFNRYARYVRTSSDALAKLERLDDLESARIVGIALAAAEKGLWFIEAYMEGVALRRIRRRRRTGLVLQWRVTERLVPRTSVTAVYEGVKLAGMFEVGRIPSSRGGECAHVNSLVIRLHLL